MARSGLQVSESDVKNFLISGVVIGAAFSAFKNVTESATLAAFLGFGLVTVLAREIGQRVIGQWMDAQVDLEVSRNGSVTALVVGMFSYISSLDLIFLTPLYSMFSGESYEHWGKEIDAIWAKRQYWMVSSGITTLLVSWIVAYGLGIGELAEMISLFTFFQLLPLDAEKSICGKLDGAYIMLWSGFMWLIFTGLTVIAMILTVL